MDNYEDDEVHGNDDDVCFQVKPAKSNTGTVDQLTTGKTQWLHIGIVTTMRMMMTLMMIIDDDDDDFRHKVRVPGCRREQGWQESTQ